jgi:hypothetical protein
VKVSAVKPSLPIIWRYLDEPGQMTWEPNDPVRYHIDTGEGGALHILRFYRDGRMTYEGGNPDEAAKAFIDALVRHWGIQNG